jgi:hypothetical protein
LDSIAETLCCADVEQARDKLIEAVREIRELTCDRDGWRGIAATRNVAIAELAGSARDREAVHVPRRSLLAMRGSLGSPRAVPGDRSSRKYEGTYMIDQVGIVLTGVIAIFLSQSKREGMRRYACLFGTCGQPFWLSSAWQAEQWGIVFVSVLYAIAWALGVWTYWLKPLFRVGE